MPRALRLSLECARGEGMSAENEGIEVGAADKAAWDAAVSSFRRSCSDAAAENDLAAAAGVGTMRPTAPPSGIRSGLAGLATLSWSDQ